MASENGGAAAPPYTSFRTFLNLLDRLQGGNIPQRIDRHYWGSFLGGTVGGHVMATLRFFGLIHGSDNEPTPALETLVDPAQRKTALADLLRRSYAPVFEAVNLERTTAGHLQQAFRNTYKIDGDTLRKAVTFFVHAAQYAEVPLSPLVTAKAKPGSGPSRTATRRRTRTTPQDGQPQDGATAGREPERLERDRTPKGGDGRDASPHGLFITFIERTLPPEGRWTAEGRERWLNAVAANVDLLIRVEEEDEGGFGGFEDDPFEEEPMD